MLIAILTFLAFVSAILTVLAQYQKRHLTHYLFKPLTILFIILIAAQGTHSNSAFYRLMIVGSLLFSLVGDVFLMLPRDRFIPGLVSFLAAHLVYIVAFTVEGGRALSFWDAI